MPEHHDQGRRNDQDIHQYLIESALALFSGMPGFSLG
jgi:hypothetical protein